MGCDSRLQSDNVRGKTDFCLCWVLQGGKMIDEEYKFCDCLKGWLQSLFICNNYIFVSYFKYHDKSSICMPSTLCQFNSCNMSPTLDVFRCLLDHLDLIAFIEGYQTEQAFSSDGLTKDLYTYYLYWCTCYMLTGILDLWSCIYYSTLLLT